MGDFSFFFLKSFGFALKQSLRISLFVTDMID